MYYCRKCVSYQMISETFEWLPGSLASQTQSLLIGETSFQGRPAKQHHSSGFSLIYRPFLTPQEFIVQSLTWLSHKETNTSNYRGTRAGRKRHEWCRHFITEYRLSLIPNWAWLTVSGSVFLSCHRDQSSHCYSLFTLTLRITKSNISFVIKIMQTKVLPL